MKTPDLSPADLSPPDLSPPDASPPAASPSAPAARPEAPVAAFDEHGARYELLLPEADRDHIQKLLLGADAPYEAAMLRDMRLRLDPGDLALDVGANIGNHSVYLACVAGAEVIAFEPNPALADTLEANVARNGVGDRVSVRRIALGARASAARFAEEKPDNRGAQALALGEGPLEVAPLDALGVAGPVRVIKIDVEGMEVEVLRGAAALIARDRPLIYLECHDEAAFRLAATWAETAGYSYWETFNATPTHLFLPTASLSLDRRLERLDAHEVVRDYRLGAQLRESRRAQSAAAALAADLRRETASLRAEAAAARAEARDRVAALEAELAAQAAAAAKAAAEAAAEAAEARAALLDRARRVEALDTLLAAEKGQAVAAARAHERALTGARGDLARVRGEFARMEKYARGLEAKYAAILASETWRAMEPVRRLLRAAKRRPPPAPFTPMLLGTAAAPAPAADPGDPAAPGGAAPRRPALFATPRVAGAGTVTAHLATYPAREGNLAPLVTAILPQCDLLRVYLNDYETVPEALRHSRIHATLGRDAAGDLKDNGKFYGASPAEGYSVFIDDDILYPPDYVQRLLAGIAQFGHRAVVGFHGTNYEPPVESYLRDRSVLPFYAASRSAFVDQLGTGTSACHSSTFAVDLDAFETTGLADLWFARRAAERGVPLVALERPANWLISMPEIGDTLFRQAQRDESRESALLRERLAPALRDGPRARATAFVEALHTPAHLERAGLDRAFSAGGAFGAAARPAAPVRFALIVTGWNCEAYVAKCFASIAAQEIGDFAFEVHAYDDASDDRTWERLAAQAEIFRIRATRGETNLGPAHARDVLLRQVEDPATVCVLLDMDDQLLPHALATLARTYRDDPDCWMTYGNWVNQHGVVNDEGVYSADEIDGRAYRSSEVFRFTHLRSFRRFLYDKVDPAHLKDADGVWLRHCSDVGLVLPLADQCASRNVVAFEQPMYLYNQYRPTGTQKRFGVQKKATFQYLRESPALFLYDA